MRDYELTFIVRILPSDEEVNQAIDQVISYIELGDNGVVKSVDRKIFGGGVWPTKSAASARALRFDSRRHSTRPHP